MSEIEIRNARIVQRLLDGASMQEVMKIEGVSRETVRKIPGIPKASSHRPKTTFNRQSLPIRARWANLLDKLRQRNSSRQCAALIGMRIGEQKRAMRFEHDWTLTQLERLAEQLKIPFTDVLKQTELPE